MDILFLEYIGVKVGGTLNVKSIHANSPFRHLRYASGQTWKVGRDIPEKEARKISSSYPSLFCVNKEKLSDEEGFRYQFDLLVDKQSKLLNPKKLFRIGVEVLAEKCKGNIDSKALSEVLDDSIAELDKVLKEEDKLAEKPKKEESVEDLKDFGEEPPVEDLKETDKKDGKKADEKPKVNAKKEKLVKKPKDKTSKAKLKRRKLS